MICASAAHIDPVCRRFATSNLRSPVSTTPRERSHVSASAHASGNVPVSYPRDADGASGQTTERPILQGFSTKTSDGLEPSTPSLPFRFRGGKRG
jgi:hypothetical protein